MATFGTSERLLHGYCVPQSSLSTILISWMIALKQSLLFRIWRVVATSESLWRWYKLRVYAPSNAPKSCNCGITSKASLFPPATPHEILDAPPEEFVGILSPQRLDRLKEAIESQIGESLGRRRVGHLNRADKVVGLRPLVQRIYDCTGEAFERALEDLLNASPFNMGARRFTRQRAGQPDLEIAGAQGTIIVQATASLDGHKPINWDKVREVPTSVGFSGIPSNFVCIGRPEFHEVAVGNANEIADRGSASLLLMPLPELAELCLQEAEGQVSHGTVLSVLENQRGHYAGLLDGTL